MDHNKRNRIIGISIAAIIILIMGILGIIRINGSRQHEYYCDKFLLTVDNRQIDLLTIAPDIQSVSELLPITNQEIAIVCRIDENTNDLLIYSFKKKDFIFHEKGIMFAWIQDDLNSTRYLKDDIVYDLDGNTVYSADTGSHITVIEYIESDFYVTATDEEYDNGKQEQIE